MSAVPPPPEPQQPQQQALPDLLSGAGAWPLSPPPVAPRDLADSARPAALVPGAPRRSRRRRLLLPLVAGLVLLAALAGGLVVLDRSGGGQDGSPRKVVAAYYAALVRLDAPAAFGRLCSEQQQSGLAAYDREIHADDATGTGIRSWKGAGGVTVHGDEARVPGRLVLTGGMQTDIVVGLVRPAGVWKVCGSDLGGVIPGPGGGGSGTTTT